MKKCPFLLAVFFVFLMGMTLPAAAQNMETVLATSWEDGQPAGLTNRVEYSRSVVGYSGSGSPPPEAIRQFHGITHTGSYSLKIAGYSQASYAYCYYRLFDDNIAVVPGMKISYWIYHEVGTPKISVDGRFTDGSTIRDFGGGALKDQYGVRIHPGQRQDPMRQWYFVEVDLTPAAGKTLDFIMFAFDTGGNGFKGQYRTYVDDFAVVKPAPLAGNETKLFETGWESGQVLGFKDRVLYSQNVAGYLNSDNPPPECSPRSGDLRRTGISALLIAGYSRTSYAFSYFKVLNVEIPIQRGMRIGYWIYHAEGTAKIAVDAHFTDDTVLRDLNSGGPVTDQYGVPIHPGQRRDPMRQWYYVEVDLSKAEGKTLDTIMFAFDNDGDGFTGGFRAWVDDFKVFYPGIHSLTGGLPKGTLGSGHQTDEVTEPDTWRWSEYFYGHQGIDQIAWEADSCGVRHNYVIGWHQNDMVEYLVKFGGEYNRLVLRGKASQPGPVKMEIYIDGQYKATVAWDANNGCNQDTGVTILGLPLGTHAIAVKFVNDGNGTGWDRNFLLDGLLVTRSSVARPNVWAYPVGSADSAAGWVDTNSLGNSFYDETNQKWYKGHLAEDWAKWGSSLGEPVYATAPGKVIINKLNCGSYLDVVVIEHTVMGFAEPLYSFYGHIDSSVQVGDWVEGRKQIGVIGDTRPTFGPHLHFQIMDRTALRNPPLSGCSDVANGVYISSGYSWVSDDYNDFHDYYDPSDSVAGNRFYHPSRFIDERKNN